MTATDTPEPGPRVIFAEPEPCETIDDCDTSRLCLSVGTCRSRHVMRPLVRATGELKTAQAECARLQAELSAAREQIEHLSRLALRARNAQAGR